MYSAKGMQTLSVLVSTSYRFDLSDIHKQEDGATAQLALRFSTSTAAMGRGGTAATRTGALGGEVDLLHTSRAHQQSMAAVASTRIRW